DAVAMQGGREAEPLAPLLGGFRLLLAALPDPERRLGLVVLRPQLAQVLSDGLEVVAGLLDRPDQPQPGQVARTEIGSPPSPGRRRQQSLGQVIADRAFGDARALGEIGGGVAGLRWIIDHAANVTAFCLVSMS